MSAPPAQVARHAEEHPLLPPGTCERVSGYGVMGLPFRSGHVLGLRRWTASSVGEGYTSIWHREPTGRWTFYESAGPGRACTRYFGAGVESVHVEPISLDWIDEHRLHVRTAESDAVDWSVELAATPMTRMAGAVASRLPMWACRSGPVLSLMGSAAGRSLGVGKVRLTGLTANGQRFEANPQRIWYVVASRAVVDGEDLGPIGAVPEQAHLADFFLPQRGLFATGRFFVTGPARGWRSRRG